MKTQEKIVKIIEDKIDDIIFCNSQTRMSDEYYVKNDAKIQVLEEIITLIEEENIIYNYGKLEKS